MFDNFVVDTEFFCFQGKVEAILFVGEMKKLDSLEIKCLFERK